MTRTHSRSTRHRPSAVTSTSVEVPSRSRTTTPTAISDVDPLPTPGERRTRRETTRHIGFTLLSAIGLVLLDTLTLGTAFASAYRLRDLSGRLGPRIPPPGDTWLVLVGLATAVILAVFAFNGAYRARRAVSRMDEFYRIASHVSLGLVVAIALASLVLGEEFVYSRQMLVYGWLFAILLVTLGRTIHVSIVGRLRARGVAADRLLIVGAGSTGQLVLDKVRRSPQLGYDVIGFARHDPNSGVSSKGDDTVDGLPVLGITGDLATIAEQERVDEIIVALSGIPHEELTELIYSVSHLPVAIRIYPDSFRLLTSDTVSVSDLNGLPTVTVRTIGLRQIDRVIKRAMDIVVSITVLVLLAPLMLLIALMVRLTSPGPVFFAQERVGQDGREFLVLKFRSMPNDAEARSGPVFASPDDARPTRFGRFIRRYSFDELPQFINVLFGEMSVVGPRPERPFFVEQFRQMIPSYMARHREKSGITGWAQVNGLRGDTSIEERTRYDLYYVENWSPLFDLKIMVKTLFHLFRRGNNAY